jgi:hypothetical protein
MRFTFLGLCAAVAVTTPCGARAGELFVLTSNRGVVELDAATAGVIGVPGATLGTVGFDVRRDGRIYVADFVFFKVEAFDAGGLHESGEQPARPLNPRLGPDGLLYVNYTDGAVRRHDPETLAVVDTFLGADPLGATRDMHFGPDGRLWVNTFDAIRSYDVRTGREVDGDPSTPEVDPFVYVSATEDFALGPDGDVFVMRSRGVLRVDHTARTLAQFIAPPGFDRPNTHSIGVGLDGDVYLSTDHEIDRYDGRTGAFLDKFAGENVVYGPTEMLFVPEPVACGPLLAGAMTASAMRRRRRRLAKIPDRA